MARGDEIGGVAFSELAVAIEPAASDALEVAALGKGSVLLILREMGGKGDGRELSMLLYIENLQALEGGLGGEG